MLERVRRYWRENERLLMITVSTVLVMSGQGIITPVLPLFAAEFGAGVATVGLTLSIFGLARLLLNVPLGLLSEDIDPKTGTLWGNFPQTYSLVGIINCAMRLSRTWEDVL